MWRGLTLPLKHRVTAQEPSQIAAGGPKTGPRTCRECGCLSRLCFGDGVVDALNGDR